MAPGRATSYSSETVSRSFGLALLFLALGCTAPAVRQPPGVAPNPASINREEPGGDASDPHAAALDRLLHAQWGWRNDKQDALHVPMPDWENWRRIRYYGVPSFVGFRYGDSHHAVLAVWIRRLEQPEESASPQACLSQFEAWGNPQAQAFGVEMGPATTSTMRWAKGDVVVKALDARVDSILAKRTYAAAYGAYLMWPSTCTVFGVAVPFNGADELAHQVRDRYVREGFAQMQQQSEQIPDL
jgi:hypothetical protein